MVKLVDSQIVSIRKLEHPLILFLGDVSITVPSLREYIAQRCL